MSLINLLTEASLAVAQVEMMQADEARTFGAAVAALAGQLTPGCCYGGIALWKAVRVAVALATDTPVHASGEAVEVAAYTALTFLH
jgi:hypothetical protein